MRSKIWVTCFLVWIAFWAVFSLTGCSPAKDTKDCYLLPDGARCARLTQFSAWVEFDRCTNGRTYRNPEWWKWIEGCR